MRTIEAIDNQQHNYDYTAKQIYRGIYGTDFPSLAKIAEATTVIPCVVSLLLQVAGFAWNQRPVCRGISGRFHVEYAMSYQKQLGNFPTFWEGMPTTSKLPENLTTHSAFRARCSRAIQEFINALDQLPDKPERETIRHVDAYGNAFREAVNALGRWIGHCKTVSVNQSPRLNPKKWAFITAAARECDCFELVF